MDLKYIMPDWDDYLDEDFNFDKDEFSSINKSDRKEIYLHEIMGEDVPYDSILVSLGQITKKKGALKVYKKDGSPGKSIRDLMRIPEKLEIIGDCGAYSYKDLEQPIYTPEEAAYLYDFFGFDIGASVDHMVVKEIKSKNAVGEDINVSLTEKQLKKRMQITIHNAEVFISEVNEKKYKFKPMGSIQGITVSDYTSIFKQYIKWGYKYIALGSLIPKTDDEILEIIQAIGAVYKELDYERRNDLHIHLFGVLRPKLLSYYKENGITSFDSASYFRKAWLRSDNNYLATNGKWYTALRVPQTSLAKNRNALVKNGINILEIQKLEKQVLETLIEYDNDLATIDEVLELLFDYDRYFDRLFEDSEKIRESYKRTLADKPWKLCSCPICKHLGIHVMIFRGYNRNKRRGFHNTIVFYNALKQSNDGNLDFSSYTDPTQNSD